MGNAEKINSFNMYKTIIESDSPISLFSSLSGKIRPLPKSKILFEEESIGKDDKTDKDIFKYFLYFFGTNHYLEEANEQ